MKKMKRSNGGRSIVTLTFTFKLLLMLTATIHLPTRAYSSKIEPLELLSLYECPQQRAFLASQNNPKRKKHKDILKTHYTQLSTLSAFQTGLVSLSIINVASYVPNYGDEVNYDHLSCREKGGFADCIGKIQAGATYLIGALTPLNIVGMIDDLIEFLCEGAETTQIVPDTGGVMGTINLLTLYYQRVFFKSNFAPGIKLKPGSLYKKQNTHSFLVTMVRLYRYIKFGKETAKKMEKIPVAPIRTTSKTLKFLLDIPEGALSNLIDSSNDKCAANSWDRKTIDKVRKFINYFSKFKLFLTTLLGVLHYSFSINNSNLNKDADAIFDYLEENNGSFTQECYRMATPIPIQVYDKSNYYVDKMKEMKEMIEEFDNAGVTRHLEGTEDTFDSEIARFEQNVELLVKIINGTKYVNDAIFNAVHFEGSLPTYEALFFTFPTAIRDFTGTFGQALFAMDPVVSYLEKMMNLVPEVPDFISNAMEQLENFICNAITPLCEEIEQFVQDKMNDVMNFLNIPTYEGDFAPYFADITALYGRLNFDFDNGIDFGSFLPDDLIEIKDYFDVWKIEDLLSGFHSKFALTPDQIFNKYHESLSTGESGSAFSTQFGRIEDSLSIGYTCEVNWTPVTAQAIYYAESCTKDLTAKLRFPCPDGQHSCTVNVNSEFIKPCLRPDQIETDEFFHTHMGMPKTFLNTFYYCFQNIDDFKFVPIFEEMKTNIVLDKMDPPAFNVDTAGDFQTELNKFGDTSQRNGVSVHSVTRTNVVDCAGGGKRIVFPVYYDDLIEPCIHGYTFPYARQANRASSTDLCGYKILFDSGRLNGYNDFCQHKVQEFIGQRRLGAGTISFVPGKGTRAYDFRVSSHPPDGNCAEPPPIDWETIALNLEICEVHWVNEGNNLINFCPFKDYNGIRYGDVGNFELSSEYLASGCVHDAANPMLLYEPIGGSGGDGFINYGWWTGARSRELAIYFDCAKRDELEALIRYPDPNIQFNSPDRSWFYRDVNDPDRFSGTPHGDWLNEAQNLHDQCFGSGTNEGYFQRCMAEGKCDFIDDNNNNKCLPNYFAWTCAPKPKSDKISRVYLFDYEEGGRLLENKELSCDSQTVQVNGGDVTVQLELEIESFFNASEQALFDWVDLTETLEEYCGIGPGVSSCTLDPTKTFSDGTTRAFPVKGYVWEIDTKCMCPAGFSRVPEDGVCVPCPAGSYRGDGDDECTACPPGTFSTEGSSACTSCPTGTYQREFNATSIELCIGCPLGAFCVGEGVEDFTLCSPGYYQSLTGQEICEPSLPGFYVPINGSTSIVPVPPGSFSGPGASEPTLCGPGTYSLLGSADACDPCPAGSYSVRIGSTYCRPCPQGYFSWGEGSIKCTKCEFGLTTQGPGATSFNDCVSVPDPYVLQTMLQEDYYHPVESIQLLSNGNFNRAINSVNAGCRDLILSFDPSVNPDDIMLDIGNGFCNDGPLNTEVCGYDGGDCCPQTCRVFADDETPLDEAAEIEAMNSGLEVGSCFWKHQRCRDPAALQMNPEGASYQCAAVAPRYRRQNRRLFEEPTAITQYDRATFLQEWNSRPVISNSRWKNGVCDHDLNNEENAYDGGDCCPNTCILHPEYLESCSHSTFQDPLGKGCDEGYGCCDPLVNFGLDFRTSDVAPPVITVVSDYDLLNDCEFPDAFFGDSSPFDVVVNDNDPCFDVNTGVAFSKIERSYDLPGANGESFHIIFGFVFQYVAIDANGNAGQTEVMVSMPDPDITFDGCPDNYIEMGFTIVGGETTTLELPIVTASSSKCGGLDVDYFFVGVPEGVVFDKDTGIATLSSGWDGTVTPSFSAYASLALNTGLSYNCQIDVTLQNYPPPVASCQNAFFEAPNPGVYLNEGELREAIDAGSHDPLSGGASSLSFSFPDIPDGLFSFGTTTVVMTVENMDSGLSAQCTALVTVTEIYYPEAVCKDVTFIDNGNPISRTSSQLTNDINGGSYDPNTGTTDGLSYSFNKTGTFPAGTHAVEMTVTSGPTGLSNTCTGNVIVKLRKRYVKYGDGRSITFNYGFGPFTMDTWQYSPYELQEVVCCSGSSISSWYNGFVKKSGCSVYSGSKIGGVCYSNKSYQQARSICAQAYSGRLCTRSEIASGCADAHECYYHDDQVWTNDAASLV